MTTKPGQSNRWADSVALVLAFIGSLVASGGSLMFLVDQARMSSSSVWPLPGLVLMDWAILGILGFLSAYGSRTPSSALWRKIAWVVVGALIPLVILGAFSIGLFVLVSLLFFLGSTIFLSMQKKEKWLDHLGMFFIGTVSNLGFLLLFVAIGQLAIRA